MEKCLGQYMPTAVKKRCCSGAMIRLSLWLKGATFGRVGQIQLMV
ncbi:hypothetical protein OU5_5443 [Pseudomonas mandelii JR-1]|uniref:Uncharacterized protein n=1 Tax=Pseudomonas mandelii JR-1 TaxID=1147786 RepID=A0A024EI69_9PSED|nr:hypothetical protein OU5_5443 [Pseudomonas mandelii JR-1]